MEKKVDRLFKIFNLLKLYFHKIKEFCLNKKAIVYSLIHSCPVIYVIGDSHVDKFIGHKSCYVIKIGSSTAFKLKYLNNSTLSNEKVYSVLKLIPSGSYLLFVFGEIDARVHIYKQFLKNKRKKSINVLADEVVRSYGVVLKDIKLRGFNVLVHGVPPSTRKSVAKFGGVQSLALRKKINYSLNSSLKKYCKLIDLPFWDLYLDLVDDEGYLLEKFSYDEIHLNKQSLSYFDEFVENNTV